MIWCESAIVPRRARTCSRLSPPHCESEASGVRNLTMGEDEDAKPVVGSADKGSGYADPSRRHPQVGQIAEYITYAEFRISAGMSPSWLC